MARELRDETNLSLDVSDPDQIPEVSSEPNRSSIQIIADEKLEEILVQVIMEDFDAAKRARDKKDYGLTSKGAKLDFEKWIKEIRDLYRGQRAPKDVPWQFCSNRSLRIAAAILDMLHARLYAAVINEELLRWRALGLEDQPKVERIRKLMHWWIWVHSRMRTFFDNWVMVVAGYGDALTESSWKITYHDKGQTQEEPVLDEMGQPLINPDGTPAIIKSRRVEPFETTTSEVYLRDRFYLQESSRDIMKEPVILEDEILYRDLLEGEMVGKFMNISNLLRERLPFDKAALRIDVSPEEAERIRDIKLRNVPVKVLKWYGSYDADGDGFAEDIRVVISSEYRIYLGGVAIRDLTRSGKRPLDYTKFKSRFDRPFENDGIGIIEEVKELAEEIDAIFNQLTDANTLSILRPGFYDPAGDLKPQNLKLAPNRLVPVTRPQENVFFPPLEIPTERLINAIRLVLEFIERLTAASSYVLGRESEIVGGSGTATRTNAIIQNAEQRFAIPGQRLREGAARIVLQHLDILQLNIPPGLESRILGEDGQPVFEENELSQEGISGEYDAYLLPDPAMGSKQAERELMQMLYSLLLQNVIVQTDPVKIYKITADLLRSYDKEPAQYLGPEPTSDMIDSPEEENTLMIQGDFKRVRAQITENHIEHMKVHMDLMQSPSLASLPPHLQQEVVQMNQAHIQEHQLMMQRMVSMISELKGGAGGKGSGTQSLEGASEPAGLESMPGPLGEALATKREGEIAGPSGI